jgi:hypothetical protein
MEYLSQGQNGNRVGQWSNRGTAIGLGSNNPATTKRLKKAQPRIEYHRLLGGLHPFCRAVIGCSLLYNL